MNSPEAAVFLRLFSSVMDGSSGELAVCPPTDGCDDGCLLLVVV